jgi:hypothetical protein
MIMQNAGTQTKRLIWQQLKMNEKIRFTTQPSKIIGLCRPPPINPTGDIHAGERTHRSSIKNYSQFSVAIPIGGIRTDMTQASSLPIRRH